MNALTRSPRIVAPELAVGSAVALVDAATVGALTGPWLLSGRKRRAVAI